MRCTFIIFVSIVFVYFGCNKHQTIDVGDEEVVSYLLSRQKDNSAFGPSGMEYTDVAWTYPAVHALKILDTTVPMVDSAYENGHKPWIEKADWKNGPWYRSLHQKSNLYKISDREGDLEKDMTKGVEMSLSFKPRTDYTEYREYHKGHFFSLSSLWYVVDAVNILNGRISNKKYVKEYVLDRQTGKGGFESLLDTSRTPSSERAHIIVTYNAVMTLKTMGIRVPNKEKVIRWVQSLQSSDGGFRWNPKSNSPSNKSDVWYTWAAVKTLDALESEPKNASSCLRWLNSLQNTDGGFGDRPGWQSRIYSTYYAVHAIDILTGNAKKGIKPKSLVVGRRDDIPEGKYSIFQAHHKSPKGGKEMVDEVVDMGINLIAVKTSEGELYDSSSNGMSSTVNFARSYAEGQEYPIEIVDSPENYAHRLKWFSGMNGNHVSNYMIPPNISKKEWGAIKSSYVSGKDRMGWANYREKVISPIIQIGTLFYPELDYSAKNAYMIYDEGLYSNKGYNAVPAAHFGNYDWVRHFPYKERWVGKLPMIADGDAHGGIHEWKENLNSFRNVFIAKDYTFESYINASLDGRSVCVIWMPSGDVRYYGSDAAVEYLKKHKNKWKWW